MENTLRPKGMYQTVNEWLKTEQIKNSKQNFLEIYPEKHVVLHAPGHIEESTRETFKTPHTSPNAFVATLVDGRIWGKDCAIITSDNHLLWELSHISIPSPNAHPIFSESTIKKPDVTNETVAVLFCEWPDNFYHWMFDVISRIHLLQKSKIPIHKYVMKPFSFLPFQKETLTALGIKKEQITFSNNNFHLKATKVVVPSREQRVGHPSKWACEFLKNSLLMHAETKQVEEKKRIYISRQGAWYRKIKNEDTLLQFLQQYQFEIIKLEEISIWEQIKLFSNAEVILTLHGAALTNLVFSSTGTKVIEVFPPRYIPTCYYVLANLIHLNYFYLIGDEENTNHYQTQPDFMDDISLDVNALQKLFSLACITN